MKRVGYMENSSDQYNHVKYDIWQWILSGWVCQILADRQIAKLLDLLSSPKLVQAQPNRETTKPHAAPVCHTYIHDDLKKNQFDEIQLNSWD